MEKEGESGQDAPREDKQIDESARMNERRSQRKKKNKRSFSPELDDDGKKKRKRTSKPFSSTSANRPCDLLPNGEAFCCHLCKSPYVTNPQAKGVRQEKRSRHVVLPQKRLDSLGREILVCNACNQILDRQIKPKKPVKEITAEQRTRYLEDAKMFAKSLAETLNEPDAEKLYCPVSVYKICGCLQKYIKGKDTDETALELRVTVLLDLMKEATQLREQKCYALPEGADSAGYGRKRSNCIGIGNGHKKSKAFELFVLKNRQHLKDDLHLCERATQKILLYSNNFLHKKLKTEERPCRITRTKGKAALGQLHDIDTLHDQSCCNDKCVKLSLTHPDLLKSWRARAVSGQTEARKVIAEMLTPAGGYNLNCYQFVSMVTGCAWATVSKVKSQLRATEARHEPSKHGVKNIWTGRHRGHTSSTACSSDNQVLESPVGQTQTDSRQEVTSELPRPSGNLAGSHSSAVISSTQQDVVKIQDLVQRQRELQEQQQIVQNQIHQALGHTGFQQIPGWIPQFAEPLSHIGSVNSAFYPAGNISQTEFPLIVPSLANLPLTHSHPGQLQPEFNHNMPTAALNVPVFNQLEYNNAQMASFSNPDFASVNQGTAGTIPQNYSLDKYIPAVSHSAVPHQHSSETHLQRECNIGDLIMKTQGQIRPSNYGSNLTHNASLLSDFSQSQMYLPQTIASNVSLVSNKEQSIARQLPTKNETIQKISETETESVILSPAELVPQQISAEKQVERPPEDFMLEDIPTVQIENMNSDVSQSAPRMILTVVDPEKGIAQQFELPNTAADTPVVLPINTNLPTLATLTVPRVDQILSPAEQQRQVQEIIMNTDSLTDVPTFINNNTVTNTQLEMVGSSAPFELNTVYNVERNLECDATASFKQTAITEQSCETESNPPVITMIISPVPDNEVMQSQSVTSQVPFHLEKIDVLFHPDHNPAAPNETVTSIMASSHDIPSVADKSTNTAMAQSNNERVVDQNTDFSSDQTNFTVPIYAVNDENFRARKKSKCREKGIYEVNSCIRNTCNSSSSSLGTHSNKVRETILCKSESKDVRKHVRKPHKSRDVSKEQGFQKLHSKNGKVFLQATTQRSGECRKTGSDIKAVDVGVSRAPYETSTRNNISDERSAAAKTVVAIDRKEVNALGQIASRLRADTKVSSGHVSAATAASHVITATAAGYVSTAAAAGHVSTATASNVRKTKNESHITDRVKDKLRQSLNIPILPKPTSSQQSLRRMPVELQPLQSSLFVIPPTPPRSQTSRNITSLLHMSKSKVQIQHAVDQNVHGYSSEKPDNPPITVSLSKSQYRNDPKFSDR